VTARADVLNRFSGFHHSKPLKRLRFNGLACTQLKQGVNETSQFRRSKTGMRRFGVALAGSICASETNQLASPATDEYSREAESDRD
jgi:hypothetical protein